MSYRIFRLLLSLIVLVGLVAVETPPAAHAAGPWYVATTGDDGNDCLSPSTPCATINGAIGKASSGDTIYVAEGSYTGMGTEVVLIDRNITLSGGWDVSFATQAGRSIIDGEDVRRGVTVNTIVTGTLERFTIQKGNKNGGGGGVLNNGTLTINHSVITDNILGAGEGAGIVNAEAAVLTLNYTTITRNGNQDLCNGTAIWNQGTITANNSLITENRVENIFCGIGSAIINHTSSESRGTITLNNTTVSHNSPGGGIYNYGDLRLNNSTVSNNTGDDSNGPGGIYNSIDGILSLNNSTITGNTSFGSGGGIFNIGFGSGVVTMQNSIVAGNTSSAGADCNGTIGSLGYNIVGDTSNCGFTATTGDLANVDPRLGLLIGSPGYHPLLSDSPAIDAGNPAGCTDHEGNSLATDQRGVARVGTCDIGAYEYMTPGPATSLVILNGDAQSTVTTLPFANPLQVAALDAQGSPVEGVAINFTAPETGPSGTFADTGTNTTLVSSNETGVATTSVFTANEQAGNYIVSASTIGGGSVNFSLGQVARPVNDDLANAEVIASLPFSDSVDSTNATFEPNEPMTCGATAQTHSVWYSFTPAIDMVVIADMFGSSFSDPNLAVYESVGPGFGGLRFLRADCMGNSMTLNVQAGTTYYLQAGSYSSGGGDLHLNLQQVPPPANDNFADAQAITSLPFSATTDIAGATTEANEPQNCAFMSKTVWYSFTATATVNIRVDTQTNNGIMNIYRATGAGITDLQHLKCMGSDEFFTFPAEAGTTYYFQVSSFADSGTVQVDVREAFPAQNDLFVNAEIIQSLPVTVSPDFTDTGIEPGEPQDCGLKNHTVWYAFTPTEAMSVRVDAQSASAFATLYRAGGSTITDLQSLPCIHFATPTIFQLEAGATYYLQVGFAFGTSASIQVDIQQVFPPANDNFADAETVNTVPFSDTVDISHAWTESNEPQFCLGMNKTVWYAFTPTQTMSIRVDTQGSSTGANLNVYQATGPGISDLNFRGCIANAGSFVFLAEAGQTYYLQAGVNTGQDGTIQVNLQQASPPANDNFSSPTVVTAIPFSTTINITDAITEPNEPQFCYFMERTVWYSFTPTETVKLRLDTIGSAIFGNVNIYRAAGPGFSDLQFHNCTGPFNIVTLLAEAGQTYYFQVGAASGETGNVQFNMAEIPDISGRIIDSITSAPLAGNVEPFAVVTLYKVCGDGCLEFIHSQTADGEGRFLFDASNFGVLLSPGTYKIEASANHYQTQQFGPFEFTTTSLDVGDLALDPEGTQIQVSIDIVPGSATNTINLRSATVQVAILSSDGFNAVNDVNRSSLTFGKTGDESSFISCAKGARDVNVDGRLDLVCTFRINMTGLVAGDTAAILRGTTVAGLPFEATDSVKVIKGPK